jgi:branched-chain amino acid transport system ATP-binding protein
VNPVVLEIRDLTASYGSVPILRGASLTVRQGEVVGLVGRNGVGKSTLVKALMGLLPASAGEITLHGVDLTGTASYLRARQGLGYVPQGRGIFGTLSVEENVRMGEAAVARVAPDAFDRVYELFPVLRTRRHQRAGSLSGGEQQMLAIARVLVRDPAVLVLDEPSEGIQPSVVQSLGDMVRDLRDRTGLAVLLVEQNWELITRATDRCIVMEKGEIVAELSADQARDADTAARYLAL